MSEHLPDVDQLSAKEPVIETGAELAQRAKVVSSEEWTRFEDHFFHGCCDCGLSHTVTLRRVGDDQHEVRWAHHETLTDESRARNEHPLWLEIQRLRTTLTGIASCSTCEACRGAAVRALGAPVTTGDGAK